MNETELMMKRFWIWIARLPLFHPVWFNIILLLLTWSIAGVAFQSNDDLVIASVLDGWGDPSYADAHVIFVNPLLTGALLHVSPLLGGVSVWPVFLALSTLGGSAAMFTILTMHARKARRYDAHTLLILVLWLLLMPGFYAALQFSQAAFLTGGAGVLACFQYGRGSRAGLAAGVALFLLGSMIRLDAALACGVFWGVMLAARSLAGRGSVWLGLREDGRLWAAWCIALVAAFGLHAYSVQSHRDVLEGCDIMAWNKVRAVLSDTSPVRSEREYQCGTYGVFANDIKMVRAFTNCDLEVFDTDYLHRLALARDGGGFWDGLLARAGKAVDLFSWEAVQDLLPCWILFVLAFRISSLRGDAAPMRWCVACLLVLILLYMASIDRLYFRVVYPTFLIASLCLLWNESYRPLRCSWKGKNGVVGSMLTVCAFALSVSQVYAAVRESEAWSYSSEAGRLLCERVEREPDSLFCVHMSGTSIDDLAPGQSIFRKAWSCSRPNVVTLGGWNFPLKPVQMKLKAMGWQRQSALNLCRDGVYIVCLVPQGDVSGMDRQFFSMLCRYIREHHGVRVSWKLDENLAGVRIYRLRQINSL